MYKEIAEINRIFDDRNLGPTARKEALCLAVSLSVAFKLELPSSETSNLKAHYLTNCDLHVKERVSAVNEHMAIDVPSCIDLVYRVYEMRYNAAFRPQLLDLRSLIDGQLLSNVPPTVKDMDEQQMSAARHIASTLL